MNASLSPDAAADGGASSAPVIVVGVSPHVPNAVLEQAVVFAAHFAAILVFVYVDAGRYVVAVGADGVELTEPIDPDLGDDEAQGFPAELRVRLEKSCADAGLPWRTAVSAGDPADALDRAAQALDAVAIVVGTHRASMRSTVAEFFTGSVAVHLAHRQARPVIVVPVVVAASNDALPWVTEG
ncbi:universal stress protein [Subtercola endophyticus]|uniref:universal stress protein n=1 Tax=Subtercola endophyticus TaxID=2895559 RepID=UPI001E5DC129|nr:universal stress protein [Subtercola endophyticus]UFS58687.1 universal stress protein [Subtercola endophyticus]